MGKYKKIIKKMKKYLEFITEYKKINEGGGLEFHLNVIYQHMLDIRLVKIQLNY